MRLGVWALTLLCSDKKTFCSCVAFISKNYEAVGEKYWRAVLSSDLRWL